MKVWAVDELTKELMVALTGLVLRTVVVVELLEAMEVDQVLFVAVS